MQHSRQGIGDIDAFLLQTGGRHPDGPPFGDRSIGEAAATSRDNRSATADIDTNLDIFLRVFPRDDTAFVRAKFGRQARPASIGRRCQQPGRTVFLNAVSESQTTTPAKYNNPRLARDRFTSVLPDVTSDEPPARRINVVARTTAATGRDRTSAPVPIKSCMLDFQLRLALDAITRRFILPAGAPVLWSGQWSPDRKGRWIASTR